MKGRQFRTGLAAFALVATPVVIPAPAQAQPGHIIRWTECVRGWLITTCTEWACLQQYGGSQLCLPGATHHYLNLDRGVPPEGTTETEGG